MIWLHKMSSLKLLVIADMTYTIIIEAMISSTINVPFTAHPLQPLFYKINMAHSYMNL